MVEVVHVSQVEDNVYALNEAGKTVMYLIVGKKAGLLLDTGFGLCPLEPMVRKILGDKPFFVVNTHSHVDHNSGNNQFEQVYVGWMDEPQAHHMLSEEDIRRNCEFFLQPVIARGYDPSEWKPGPAPRVVPVRQGDEFDLGGIRLHVLETPGHTVGSICLWEKKKGWLFTGDLMLTWEVWGHLPTSSCLRFYAESLDKLSKLPGVKWAFPAHAATVCSDDPDDIRLPQTVITTYAKGTWDIVNGKEKGQEYSCPIESISQCMRCARFETGGMVFDPERIG